MSHRYTGTVGKKFEGDRAKAQELQGAARLLVQQCIDHINHNGGWGQCNRQKSLRDGTVVSAIVLQHRHGWEPIVRVEIYAPSNARPTVPPQPIFGFIYSSFVYGPGEQHLYRYQLDGQPPYLEYNLSAATINAVVLNRLYGSNVKVPISPLCNVWHFALSYTIPHRDPATKLAALLVHSGEPYYSDGHMYPAYGGKITLGGALLYDDTDIGLLDAGPRGVSTNGTLYNIKPTVAVYGQWLFIAIPKHSAPHGEVGQSRTVDFYAVPLARCPIEDIEPFHVGTHQIEDEYALDWVTDVVWSPVYPKIALYYRGLTYEEQNYGTQQSTVVIETSASYPEYWAGNSSDTWNTTLRSSVGAAKSQVIVIELTQSDNGFVITEEERLTSSVTIGGDDITYALIDKLHGSITKSGGTSSQTFVGHSVREFPAQTGVSYTSPQMLTGAMFDPDGDLCLFATTATYVCSYADPFTVTNDFEYTRSSYNGEPINGISTTISTENTRRKDWVVEEVPIRGSIDRYMRGELTRRGDSFLTTLNIVLFGADYNYTFGGNGVYVYENTYTESSAGYFIGQHLAVENPITGQDNSLSLTVSVEAWMLYPETTYTHTALANVTTAESISGIPMRQVDYSDQHSSLGLGGGTSTIEETTGTTLYSWLSIPSVPLGIYGTFSGTMTYTHYATETPSVEAAKAIGFLGGYRSPPCGPGIVSIFTEDTMLFGFDTMISTESPRIPNLSVIPDVLFGVVHVIAWDGGDSATEKPIYGSKMIRMGTNEITSAPDSVSDLGFSLI